MFLVLLRAPSLLYTPCVLLGSLLFFAINTCFFIHQKKKNTYIYKKVKVYIRYDDLLFLNGYNLISKVF